MHKLLTGRKGKRIMDAYKTETGRREDLEAIEVNPVLGDI